MIVGMAQFQNSCYNYDVHFVQCVRHANKDLDEAKPLEQQVIGNYLFRLKNNLLWWSLWKYDNNYTHWFAWPYIFDDVYFSKCVLLAADGGTAVQSFAIIIGSFFLTNAMLLWSFWSTYNSYSCVFLSKITDNDVFFSSFFICFARIKN